MANIIRICLFMTVVFEQKMARANINASSFKNSVIFSTLMKNISETQSRHIRIFPGTIDDIKGNSNFKPIGLTNVNTRLLSIDTDYARSRLFIYDSNNASIYAIENFNWRGEFTNMSITHIHDGLSREYTRIAVDWVSNNIYWTDGLYGWIVIQSGSKVNKYKILIDDDIEKPFALAVDPVNKYLFWSDIGSTVKIVRASLTGSNAKAIVTTGLAFPTSVDIDRSANYLVWVDGVRNTLETCSFDGTDRRVIVRMSHSSFYDVAVFKDLVAVTENSNGTLLIYNKYTGEKVRHLYITNGDPFLAVALYTPEVQPSQVDRCANFGCSDICVNEKTGPVCICKEGYKLNQDSVYKTCSEDLGTYHRAVVYSNATNICMMDFRTLTTNVHVDTVNCFLGDGNAISQFDLDMNDRRVVYADGNDLISANIETNSLKNRLTTARGAITGIAVDWQDNNVYWCTEGYISVISEETKMESNLIDSNLSYPKQLRVAPFHNILVWISGPIGSQKIEKAGMDGSNRVSLFTSSSSVEMKGLTIDSSKNKMYFIDGSQIKSCDFNGNQLTTLKPTSSVLAPMLILIYKNLLVAADNSAVNNVIKVLEKNSEPKLTHQISDINLETLTDLHVLDQATQPKQQGPCDIMNGKCEQICIPIGRNKVCKCEYGYQLDNDNRTCKSSLLTKNFLVVTDLTHNAIYQVSLDDDDVIAIDTKTYGSPTAIAYNYMTQQVIWSTNVLIHRLSLKEHSYKVLFNTEILKCHADSFAIDYPSGNIYYTANPILQTGFVGVGVISPQGPHKRLITAGTKPKDIVLDSEKGLMFWTDHGSVPAFVAKANMDGTGMSYVKRDGLVWPNGLAIDSRANTLYVTDGQKDVIYKCSYVGICTIHYTDRGSRLLDIIILGDYLYYTALDRPYIAKLHKTNPVSVIKIGNKPELGRLGSLALHSSLFYQSQSTNCSKNNGLGTCSTFCLPKAVRYVCACEDNVALRNDSRTCENVFLRVTTEKPSKMPLATAVGVSVGVLALASATCVLVICIVKRSSNRKNNNNDPQHLAQIQFDYNRGFVAPPSQSIMTPDSTCHEQSGNQQGDAHSHSGYINPPVNNTLKPYSIERQFDGEYCYISTTVEKTLSPNSNGSNPNQVDHNRDRRNHPAKHKMRPDSNRSKHRNFGNNRGHKPPNVKYTSRPDSVDRQQRLYGDNNYYMSPSDNNILRPNSNARKHKNFGHNKDRKPPPAQTTITSYPLDRKQKKYDEDRGYMSPPAQNTTSPGSKGSKHNQFDYHIDRMTPPAHASPHRPYSNDSDQRLFGNDKDYISPPAQNTMRPNSHDNQQRQYDNNISYMRTPAPNTLQPTLYYHDESNTDSDQDSYILLKITKISEGKKHEKVNVNEKEVPIQDLRQSADRNFDKGKISTNPPPSNFNTSIYKDAYRHMKPTSHCIDYNALR